MLTFIRRDRTTILYREVLLGPTHGDPAFLLCFNILGLPNELLGSIVAHLINIKTPVGILRVEGEKAITSVEWGESKVSSPNKLLIDAKSQILDYFNGDLHYFKLPVVPSGTPFQTYVWHNLTKIPYAQTLTYGELAQRLKTSPRAIGGACRSNPVPLIIPCHRIVGQNGNLTGFSGGDGVRTKEALLLLEQRTLRKSLGDYRKH